MIQANNNPEYRSALRTIWFILHKCSKIKFTASTTTQASPPVTIVSTVWTDPHVTDALADLKIILERAASLDPLLDLLIITISDTIAASSKSGSDLMDYFSTLGE
jgi:hypothetical protein